METQADPRGGLQEDREGPLEVRVCPPWWADRWTCLVLGMLTGFLAGGLVSYLCFHPTPKHPAPGWSIAGPLALSVALWQFLPRPARVRRLIVDVQGLTLEKTDGSRELISADDVRLVAARRALALGGGEVLPVRRVQLVTARGERAMKMPRGCAPVVLEFLSVVCTTAIFLGPEGPPLLPRALVELDPVGTVSASRVLVRRELGRQARRTAALGVALLALCGVLTVLLVASASSGGRRRAKSIGKGAGSVIVCATLAVAAAAHAARTWRRARQADRALEEYAGTLGAGGGAGGGRRVAA